MTVFEYLLIFVKVNLIANYDIISNKCLTKKVK